MFSDLFAYLSNNTLSRAELSNSGKVRNIHYGDVLIKYGEVIVIEHTEIPYVADVSRLRKPDYLSTGDVVIADTAEDDTVGKAVEIINNSSVAVVSGLHTIPCRPKKRFVPSYLGYYVNSAPFHTQLHPYMQGIKVTSISKGNIGKTYISSPDLEEQQKITSWLNLLSSRIEKQRQLVEALKSYKRGLLFGVLSEKIKLTDDEWDTHKIGDFLISKNIKQLPSEEAPLMAFTATGGVCEKGERYDRGFLVKDESTKLYKRTDYGDFIYSSNNLDVGSIGLNLYGSAVISDVYEVFSIEQADRWFISEAIKQKKILNDILKYRQGCLYGQYRIYAEDFLAVKIKVPSIATQQKIGSLFSGVDRKIGSVQGVLEKLERLKASLLQQLFI